MNGKDVAKHYLKFWPTPARVADNAPAHLRDWVKKVADPLGRQVVHDAMRAVSGVTVHEPSSITEIVSWYMNYPRHIVDLDEILASKRPPKTHDELFTRAFAASKSKVADTVREFLKEALR